MNSHFNLHKYSEENVYPPVSQVWLYAYVIYCSVEWQNRYYTNKVMERNMCLYPL